LGVAIFNLLKGCLTKAKDPAQEGYCTQGE
jgi:hypothetical protein